MADEEEKKEDAEETSGEENSEGSADSEKEDGEEGESLDPPKKKLSKKMLIIIAAVGVVLLLGGIGAGLFFTGIIGGHSDEAAGKAADAELAAEDEAVEHEVGVPTFLPLGDILVNLSGGGKRPNFLKIKVSLELADEKDVATLEALRPRIIDHFQIYLRELRIEDLRGSAGLYRLREELLLRVTEVVRPVRVRNVLFQEMLVQ